MRGRLDLVGDVRDDLNGLAFVKPLALLLDDREVDLAGGVVAVFGQRRMGEPLVVAQVEVGLGAVVEHVDLTVLVRAHRPRIDVDVGVELLEPDPQPALFQDHADRGAGQSLAERANHAARHEDVLRHRFTFDSSVGAGKGVV